VRPYLPQGTLSDRRPHQPSALAVLGAAARLAPSRRTSSRSLIDGEHSIEIAPWRSTPRAPPVPLEPWRSAPPARPTRAAKPQEALEEAPVCLAGRCCHGGRALGSLVAPRNPVRVECLRYGRSHSSLLLSANAETSRGGRDLPRRRGRCRRPVELSETWLWHARLRRSHVSGVSGSVSRRSRPEREPCP
jgi:hypothetical protein